LAQETPILARFATGIFKDFSVVKQWLEYIDPMEPDEKVYPPEPQ